MLELLAPAGSRQALQAAVQNGADAVYLGAGAFNARMGARNFSMEELAEAVTYCHIRGVRVYLTVNTLVTDREMERAAELLAEYQSWLRRFAAAFRLPVLDFDRAFTRWGEEGLFQPDGLHPNAAGHCLMAETAAALIRSL